MNRLVTQMRAAMVAVLGLTMATACRSGVTWTIVLHERPNVLLIMADDMGFSDIGASGSEIATPNLDRLAAGGLRFTQFYNTARCSPTRASLLTGLYPHQAGVGHLNRDLGAPAYRGELSANAVTIAELLRAAGYATRMSGKWHATSPSLSDDDNWPRQRGFDRFYGTLTDGGNFFNPSTLILDDTPTQADGDDYHYTDAISDRAVEFLDGLWSWQFWQLRCRIGAMSFEKVTSPAAAWAVAARGEWAPRVAATTKAIPMVPHVPRAVLVAMPPPRRAIGAPLNRARPGVQRSRS